VPEGLKFMILSVRYFSKICFTVTYFDIKLYGNVWIFIFLASSDETWKSNTTLRKTFDKSRIPVSPGYASTFKNVFHPMMFESKKI
jgi:hypothetical protein